MVATYDPKQVTVIIGGSIISGFADGTFVKISRNNDQWSLKVGADGSGARAKSNDRSGRVELTLIQSSPSNDVLSAFAAADELSNGGLVTGLVQDKSGRTLCAFETGWIVKYPDAEFAKEIGDRTWVIETDDLNVFIGGN